MTSEKTGSEARLISVPAVPEAARIESMCLRFDHGHNIKQWHIGAGRVETDEEFEGRREANRVIMRQLYEEATGQGFFRPGLSGA